MPPREPTPRSKSSRSNYCQNGTPRSRSARSREESPVKRNAPWRCVLAHNPALVRFCVGLRTVRRAVLRTESVLDRR